MSLHKRLNLRIFSLIIISLFLLQCKKATASTEISHGKLNLKESMETTHYSIIDQFKNARSGF